MSIQLDISEAMNGGYGAGRGVGYVKASATSLAGALHAEKTLGQRHAEVFAMVARNGGATCGEIAHKLGVGMNCVSGRLCELEQLQKIVVTTDKRPSPTSGKNGYVWIVAHASRVAA